MAWYGLVWYGGPGQNIHVLCMEEPGHGTGTPPTIICGIKLVEMFRAVSRMQSERKSEKKIFVLSFINTYCAQTWGGLSANVKM